MLPQLCPRYKGGAFASYATMAKVVVPAGVEPAHAADLAERRHKLPVLPLHHRTKMVAKEGVEPSRLSWFEQVSSASSE